MSTGIFSETEYSHGFADGCYEAAHGDRPFTEEQLATCTEWYADGYRKGYAATDETDEDRPCLT